MRNEHISALIFNPHRQVSLEAHQAVDHLYNLLNLIAAGSMPWYFFVILYSVRQVALYKVDPKEVPKGIDPEFREVC